jgi:tetratricopeptide (TPR) repeat protein
VGRIDTGANVGRFGDAGRLILSGLGITPEDVGLLSPDGKKLAYLAATYFTKAGDTPMAVEMFVALGERNRAAALLEQSGDLIGARRLRENTSLGHPSAAVRDRQSKAVGGKAVSLFSAQRLEKEGNIDLAIKTYFALKRYSDAARLLRQLGRTAEAADMYAEGGMAYEAAACYLEVEDTGKGLDNLVRVSRNDPRYRKAAQHAARLGVNLNVLSFELENFLAELIRTGPKDAQEEETFLRLSTLYEKQNLLENAKETLTKILKRDPAHKEASKRLEKLERSSRASPAVYEKIKEQDESFMGAKKKASNKPPGQLREMPPLPDLPPVPNITGLTVKESPTKDAVASTMATVYSPTHPEVGTPQREEETFEVGRTIQNRYRLDEEIGRGGMAVVFRAHDNELEEDIAIKLFLQQILDPRVQEESIARFKQELKLSRQLTHQNIIRLYDIGLLKGHRYITMELLEGSDLESMLGRPLDFALGLGYLVQAAAGLQAAHDKGVVHRDIKPENLFITTGHLVKVMDFGIAKNTYKQGLTMEGMTAGTPQYMAPEQISAFSEVTASADLYSLGLVAYKMFTGTLPFDHDELGKLMMMQLNETPAPPRDHNPDIPEELERIILKLLEKDPNRRFTSARELAGHLQKLRARYRRG